MKWTYHVNHNFSHDLCAEFIEFTDLQYISSLLFLPSVVKHYVNCSNFLQVKCYKSTFDPPKKEQKSKALSANIQKFLARKEEEERQKAIEAKKKKDVSIVMLH